MAAAQDRFQQISGLLQAVEGQPELDAPTPEMAHRQAQTLLRQANARTASGDARATLENRHLRGIDATEPTTPAVESRWMTSAPLPAEQPGETPAGQPRHHPTFSR